MALQDRVLIEKVVAPTKSVGGVLLPDSAVSKVGGGGAGGRGGRAGGLAGRAGVFVWNRGSGKMISAWQENGIACFFMFKVVLFLHGGSAGLPARRPRRAWVLGGSPLPAALRQSSAAANPPVLGRPLRCRSTRARWWRWVRAGGRRRASWCRCR